MKHENLKERAEAYEDGYCCPRCGKARMHPERTHNSLSRHADIYICSVCGMDEAIRAMVGDVLPDEKWACWSDAESEEIAC